MWIFLDSLGLVFTGQKYKKENNTKKKKKCYFCVLKIFVMKSKNMDYTAIITKTKSGRYIAQCKELPAALTQGNTEEEALENLQDAIDLILETEKEEKEKESKGNKFIQRKIAIL